ncbi:hypothetical protein SAMD00023353_6300360 [Rosellinia necatrix]|uniref:Uncharacterized protein n=1 Tax=Rosellinia necatrix TaxID=77044 RepID=A0A1S8AAC0_ROSNE|nr:hypothetical protein SAMD00023353_6300360 [Rosellinia necatrix]
MSTGEALKTKVDELEKMTTIVAEKCHGSMPEKPSLEAIAHELLSTKEAHDPAIDDLNNFSSVAEAAAAVTTGVLGFIAGALTAPAVIPALMVAVFSARARITYWIADGGGLDLYSP